MATKKSTSKKAAKKKTVMEKIGDTASHLKEELVIGKDHLLEMAGSAIDSVKSTIQNITHKKKKPAAKAKKAAAPAVKKSIKRAKPKPAAPAAKKSAPAKKTTKKVAKKATSKK